MESKAGVAPFCLVADKACRAAQGSLVGLHCILEVLGPGLQWAAVHVPLTLLPDPGPWTVSNCSMT